jgi:hypothetical protein
MAPKTKDSEKKEKTLQLSTPSCLKRGSAPFPTKLRIPSTNTSIGCQRNNSKTFTKKTEFFVVGIPAFFHFVLQIYHHYFLISILTPFTFPSFLMLQSIVLPPNYPFCPFLSSLCLPFLPFPNLSPHYPSSYTLTTCGQACYTKCTHPQAPTIPNQAHSVTTAEIHHNIHQGHKTQQPLYFFPHPPTQP